MNSKGIRLGSHRESINSKQTKQAALGRKDKHAELAAQHKLLGRPVKNKFLSNKERNAINELYREHNFPNMNNQIARELGRVTNEQLLSAHL